MINNILPIITLLIGAYVTYFFTQKAKIKESTLKHKEEQYAKLLVKLQGFIGHTSNAQTKKEFFEEQYKSWLYSSDEVIENINKLIDLIKENRGKTPNPEEGRKAIGNIVLAMRKNLYGSKTKLKYDSFQYTDVIS